VTSDPGRPLVGIVLVNYNGARFMPECIESLVSGDYSNFKLVIVDNRSTDGSREWIAALETPAEKLLLDSNTGITGGNNAGIKRCLDLGCDEILLLNNDTVEAPDFLSRMVDAREPRRMLVPRIYFHDAPTIINTNFGDFDYVRGRSIQRFYGQPDSEASSKPATGTMTGTCALMFSVDLVKEIGLMDDAYFIYFDDTDLVARAVKAEYLVKYVPEAKLWHKESSSSGGRPLGPLPLFYQTRNRLYFMAKHQRNRLLLSLFWLYFLSTRLVRVAKWQLSGDQASIFAFRAAFADYRAHRMGFAEPARYTLPGKKA